MQRPVLIFLKQCVNSDDLKSEQATPKLRIVIVPLQVAVIFLQLQRLCPSGNIFSFKHEYHLMIDIVIGV